MLQELQAEKAHLLRRVGFGVSAEIYPQVMQQDLLALYQEIKENSLQISPPIQVVNLDHLNQLTEAGRASKSFQERNRYHRRCIQQLNKRWLDEMCHSPAQLREKMALFWHGHFACRSNNSYHQQQLLQTIRSKALGRFGDLLKAVSQSAAMLSFLNNQQNRKQHPNENFAREVMELFTLGIGQYTEQDVKEAARAFTGWAFNRKGEFVLREKLHDSGEKTILGVRGNLSGMDVLNILLKQKATARHICTKVYTFFVQETLDQEHLNYLADRFYQSNYDIQDLMDALFTSTWFYDAQHMGALIKSPVELLIGIRRALPMKIQNKNAQIQLQRLLGQWLFYPPNVAGWAGGKSWIDSSSLMLRLRLPKLIQDNASITYKPKQADDVSMGMQEKKKGPAYQIQAEINWKAWTSYFTGLGEDALISALSAALLPKGSQQLDTLKTLKAQEDQTESELIEAYTIGIMSLPEYQLC